MKLNIKVINFSSFQEYEKVSERNKLEKKLYSFDTVAIDAENISNVFESVKDIIFRDNLNVINGLP